MSFRVVIDSRKGERALQAVVRIEGSLSKECDDHCNAGACLCAFDVGHCVFFSPNTVQYDTKIS
jgi:hypothetical protein